MKSCRALLLSIALEYACASCAVPVPQARPLEPPPYVVQTMTPVFIDANFTGSEMRSIERAISRWNRALAGAEVFTIATEQIAKPRSLLQLGGGPVVWGVTVELEPASPPADDGPYFAQVFASNDVRFYDATFTGDNANAWEVVALHELGHVLGLDDNETGAHLMARPLPSAYESLCIDAGTIQRIVVHHSGWHGVMRPECP